MVGHWAVRGSQDRVKALARECLGSHAYRQAVRQELQALAGHDAWVWALSDPRTTVGIAPMAEVPCPQELPLLIALKYQTHVNRWTELAAGPSPAASLKSATRGEPAVSELWERVLCRYGIVDVLSVIFADRWGLWGWLDLWRGPGSHDFSVEEVRCMAVVASEVTAGLRECSAREFQARGNEGQGGNATGHRQAVLVLADDLSVVSQTESAALWLDLLQRGPRPHHGIPAEVLNVAAQLLAQERGVDAHPARSCVHVGKGVWASLSAARMRTPSSGATAPIAVTVQDCLPSERIAVFERSFTLSPRECQLLELTASGLDTTSLARELAVSKYTVQDQFKSLFGKCSVQSRGALLAMALGPLAPGGP